MGGGLAAALYVAEDRRSAFQLGSFGDLVAEYLADAAEADRVR